MSYPVFLKLSYLDSGTQVISFNQDAIVEYREIYSQDINLTVLTSRKPIIYYRGIEVAAFSVILKPLKHQHETDIENLLAFDGIFLLNLYNDDGSSAGTYDVKVDQNTTLFYRHGDFSGEDLIKLLFYRVKSNKSRVAVMIMNDYIGV